MKFTGNAGFSFDALTWEHLPPALRGPGPEPQGPGAEGILIYGPNADVELSGNSRTPLAGDACQGIVANTVDFSGGATLRIACDRDRPGNPPGAPARPISLAY